MTYSCVQEHERLPKQMLLEYCQVTGSLIYQSIDRSVYLPICLVYLSRHISRYLVCLSRLSISSSLLYSPLPVVLSHFLVVHHPSLVFAALFFLVARTRVTPVPGQETTQARVSQRAHECARSRCSIHVMHAIKESCDLVLNTYAPLSRTHVPCARVCPRPGFSLVL